MRSGHGHRVCAVALSTVVAVLALSGCSTTATPNRARVQAALVTSGIPRDQAQCATGELFKILSKGQLRNLAERGSGALDDKTSTALSTAIGTCLPKPEAGTTVPSTGSGTTTPQTAPSNSNP